MSKPDLETEVANNASAIKLLMGWIVRLEDQILDESTPPAVSSEMATFKDRMLARQVEDLREFENSKSGQVRMSPAYGDKPERARIFSMKMDLSNRSVIMENSPQRIKDICHLGIYGSDLVELKAIRMEDEEKLDRIIIQRWDARGDITKTQAITFMEEEISQLLAFLISSVHARYDPEATCQTDLDKMLARACKSLDGEDDG